MRKNTLVLGASLNTERYSNLAIKKLRANNFVTFAIGAKMGKVLDVDVFTNKIDFNEQEIDTVTLYLNPKRQEEYYDYILALKPNRVIFNPGTENGAFFELLNVNQIGFEQACTLVLLNTNQY